MSINRSQGPSIVFWNGEMVMQDHDNVQVVFKKNTHSNEHLKGTKSGKIYLTNYRLIFQTKDVKDMLREISMPFKQIKDFEIKQPMLGANYLYGRLIAEPNGGWEGSVMFEITFKSGGAIEVGHELVKLATKPLQPMYSATIGTSHGPIQGTAYYFPNPQPVPAFNQQPVPAFNQQPANFNQQPPPPPAYSYPQQPYPPTYTSNPQYATQPGNSLPPEYDPYQTPPAYNPNYQK